MTLVLHGLGVSQGVAMGRAYILHPGMPEIVERPLERHAVDAEVERLQRALATAAQQLDAVRAGLPGDASEMAAFIDMDLLMLKDEAMAQGPAEIIRTRQCNAEWALKQQGIALMQMFDAMEDDYLRSRRVDIEQLVRRLQRILIAEGGAAAGLAPGRALAGRVVVAEELIPADAILLQQQGAAAFVTAFGGPTSHTAILARTLGTPAVSGLHHATALLRNEETLIVDGAEGVVLADPDELTLRHYRRRRRDDRNRRTALEGLRERPAVTEDGVAIELQANIELPADVAAVRRSGAAGVGLYRTEFLFMNRPAPPEEEEQLRAYLRVLRALRGAPLTIRTLDLGADKPLPGYGEAPSANPALGLRAVRLCLKEPGLFRPQLRAILRASARGPVRVMIPMMSSCQEILQVRALLEDVQAELHAEGRAFDPHLPVGAMIEVPAAALAADLFARHMDFLSIGTNDLIQYTLAVDRIDDAVSYLYDPLHPAVLQLIQHTLAAGLRARVPVAMCGEMAGDPRYTRLLLGMGLTAFSVHPSALPEIKYAIRHTDTTRLHRLVRQLLRADYPEDAQDLLRRINAL